MSTKVISPKADPLLCTSIRHNCSQVRLLFSETASEAGWFQLSNNKSTCLFSSKQSQRKEMLPVWKWDLCWKEEIPQFHCIPALPLPRGGIQSNTEVHSPPGTLSPHRSPVYTPLWFGSGEARPGESRNGLDFHLGLPKPRSLLLSIPSLFPLLPLHPMHRNWHGHRCLFLLWAVYLALNAFKIISQLGL